jgi:hypothetical protein
LASGVFPFARAPLADPKKRTGVIAASTMKITLVRGHYLVCCLEMQMYNLHRIFLQRAEVYIKLDGCDKTINTHQHLQMAIRTKQIQFLFFWSL